MKSSDPVVPPEAWRIALFGDGAVGKTAIAVKYTRGTFLETYDPTIEDWYRVHARVDEQPTYLEIVDTAGQDDYATLRDQWLHEGDAYILVYAIDSRRSFDRISGMDQSITRARNKSTHPYTVSILVGNKTDLAAEGQRQVATQEGSDLAARFGCFFLETSAKDGHNIRRLFEILVRAMRDRREGRPSQAPPGTIFDRGGPSSPIMLQSPSSFRPPRGDLPSSSATGQSDQYTGRQRPNAVLQNDQPVNRQRAHPGLRASASAYPLPRSPSAGQSFAPLSNSPASVRPRHSVTTLRPPPSHSTPPVPPLPPQALPPLRIDGPSRRGDRSHDIEPPRREVRERREGSRGKDGRRGRDGKCTIC